MYISNKSKQNQTNKVSTWATAAVLFLGGWGIFPHAVLSKEPTLLISQSRSLEATSAQEETLYLNNDRTYSYNLIASQRTTIDGVTIPAGATIVGKYVPAEGGLRYVAETVIYRDYSYRIDARSDVLEDVKDPRDTSIGAIAGDAGIGAAGGTILGEVLGDEANVEEILGGAAAGVIVGNVTADRVVVIEPDQPIVLYSN